MWPFTEALLLRISLTRPQVTAPYVFRALAYLLFPTLTDLTLVQAPHALSPQPVIIG